MMSVRLVHIACLKGHSLDPISISGMKSMKIDEDFKNERVTEIGQDPYST